MCGPAEASPSKDDGAKRVVPTSYHLEVAAVHAAAQPGQLHTAASVCNKDVLSITDRSQIFLMKFFKTQRVDTLNTPNCCSCITEVVEAELIHCY